MCSSDLTTCTVDTGAVVDPLLATAQYSNNNPEGFTTTATAAGTTTLTVSSNRNQEFTGTTTQTVKLPVVSTLPVGFKFEVFNNSTGIVTVQSSGANTVYAIPAGESAEFTSILNTGTTAASWTYTTPNAGGSGSSNSYVKLTGAGTTYTVGATDTHILSQRAATQTFTLPTASSNANRQL